MNGTEDLDLEWSAVDWRHHEDEVRRLRRRIFKASQQGDLKKVRNLQKLMLRSYSNTLVSVRRVTQQNAGRSTAGIDGQVVTTSRGRAELAVSIHSQSEPWKAKPVKRVYIPKSNGKQRPLGIPVLRDRVIQARVKNALEPEWEAKFEARSYGFRPGRSTQDAVQCLFKVLHSAKRIRGWVLEADLEGAFDHIGHDHLLNALGTFPAKGLVREWLKAGVVDGGKFAPTTEGTPQGGVISPLLLNVALHGLEKAAGVRYGWRGKPTEAKPGPVLVRYADDFVVLCRTKDEAERCRRDIEGWLESTGVRLSPEKTGIVRLSEGFDFLGFNVRTYNGKLLIKPSRAALKRFRERLAKEVSSLQGANALAIITRLNPIIRGWSAYYRHVVSKKTFASLDAYMWQLLWKWARRSHRVKSHMWIGKHYWGRFHRGRNDKWVFGDRKTGAYLIKFQWTEIVRHSMVKDTASPDDPSLIEYWAERGKKRGTTALMPKSDIVLAKRQQGKCPMCGELLIPTDGEPQSAEDWVGWYAACNRYLHRHHAKYRQYGGSDGSENIRLVHSECHRAHHAQDPRNSKLL